MDAASRCAAVRVADLFVDVVVAHVREPVVTIPLANGGTDCYNEGFKPSSDGCLSRHAISEGVDVQSFVRSFVFKGLLGAVSAMVGASAWAGAVGGGSVTFSVLDAQAVPLLSDLMVLMLVALVAVLAYRALRTGAAGRPLASVVAMGIVVAGGVLSGRLESVAQAVPVVVGLTLPGGGTVAVVPVGVDVQIQNQLPKQVTIQSVTANAPNTVGNPVSAPKCLPGTTVLQPSGSCYVFFVAG